MASLDGSQHHPHLSPGHTEGIQESGMWEAGSNGGVYRASSCQSGADDLSLGESTAPQQPSGLARIFRNTSHSESRPRRGIMRRALGYISSKWKSTENFRRDHGLVMKGNSFRETMSHPITNGKVLLKWTLPIVAGAMFGAACATGVAPAILIASGALLGAGLLIKAGMAGYGQMKKRNIETAQIKKLNEMRDMLQKSADEAEERIDDLESSTRRSPGEEKELRELKQRLESIEGKDGHLEKIDKEIENHENKLAQMNVHNLKDVSDAQNALESAQADQSTYQAAYDEAVQELIDNTARQQANDGIKDNLTSMADGIADQAKDVEKPFESTEFSSIAPGATAAGAVGVGYLYNRVLKNPLQGLKQRWFGPSQYQQASFKTFDMMENMSRSPRRGRQRRSSNLPPRTAQTESVGPQPSTVHDAPRTSFRQTHPRSSDNLSADGPATAGDEDKWG